MGSASGPCTLSNVNDKTKRKLEASKGILKSCIAETATIARFVDAAFFLSSNMLQVQKDTQMNSVQNGANTREVAALSVSPTDCEH